VRTAEYFDAAITSPERLCLDLLADAHAAGSQARAANYVRVEGAEGRRVTLHDLETDTRIQVRPQIVVNAAGPWIDLANQALGRPTRYIGGTKGSHLVLKHPQLRQAIGEKEFFFENSDGRIVLIYPLQNLVMVGTSDIPVDDPDSARCSDEEVEYFLAMLRKIFPRLPVNRSQIVFRFSGVRPLPAEDEATTGQISRDHEIRFLEDGHGLDFPILSLVGGKWTTFRAFAEQAADAVLERLAITRTQNTQSLPIGGGSGYPGSAATRKTWLDLAQQKPGLDRARLDALLDRYGTRAQEAAAYIQQAPDEPLSHHPAYTQREIEWLVAEEMAIHLDDLLLRRTKLAMLGQLSAELVNELAALQGEILKWDEASRRHEVARALAILSDKHQVTL
jgi:glycerol-3-phosphate dehydrogenase